MFVYSFLDILLSMHIFFMTRSDLRCSVFALYILPSIWPWPFSCSVFAIVRFWNGSCSCASQISTFQRDKPQVGTRRYLPFHACPSSEAFFYFIFGSLALLAITAARLWCLSWFHSFRRAAGQLSWWSMCAWLKWRFNFFRSKVLFFGPCVLTF